MEKSTGKKRWSIRWQLYLAFAVVSCMAIGSGGLAWVSMELSHSRIKVVTGQTLPLVSSAQSLSREVALFSLAVSELPRIEEEEQRQTLFENLRARMDLIASQLSILHSTGFEPKSVFALQQDVQLLVTNLKAQSRLATEFLQVHDVLVSNVTGLSREQDKFVSIATPKIAAQHRAFLTRGREIGTEIRKVLAASADAKTRSMDPEVIDQKIRVGFETLLSTAVGEMRANLELVGITYHLAGLLHEAADAGSRERVAELKRQFVSRLPDLTRIRLILGQAEPDNRKLLFAGMPIIRYGLGEGSIFHLRDRELQLRAKAAEYTVQTFELTDSLARTVDQLTQAGRKLADGAAQRLDQELRQGLSLQIVVVFMVVVLSICIGYIYVGRRIIDRIQHLQRVMEEQADGNDVPIPVEGGDEIGAMARSLNSFVEQRSRVEMELREAVHSLRETKQIAGLGNFTHHPSSGSWTLSGAFCELIGRDRKETDFDDEQFWKHVHGADRHRLRLLLERARQSGGETFEATVRLIREDGEQRTVQLYVRHDDKKNDEEHRQLGTVQDITERVRMEEELLQARKMESLGTLAGGIGHDFNNIMTGILGNISLARRLLEPGHELEELLENAEGATRRARELTARMLSLTETARPVCAATHLPELIQEAAEFVLTGTGVTLKMEVEDGLQPVAMDSGQMTTVIQSLVENSVYALGGQGEVVITCRNMDVRAENLQGLVAGSYVRIQVRDRGAGIAPEHLSRVFDPYFTTIQRDSRKGRGLGLAICRSVILRHGGSIGVDSEPGLGTVFTIWLPTLDDEQVSTSPTEKRRVSPTRMKILLMDDEQMVRDIARAMLQHLGYDVATAKDGLEAIELYEESLDAGSPFTLMILDLTVPGGMGGVETAEYMRQHQPDLPLVLSSGYANDPVVANFQAYGFIDAISKPYDLGELQSALKVLESKLERDSHDPKSEV